MQPKPIIIAFAIGVLGVGLGLHFALMPVVGIVQECVTFVLPSSAPDGFYTVAVDLLVVLIVFGPGVLAAVLLAIRLNRSKPDDQCRCRKCGYILRGLAEPRCPECGEVV